MMYILGEILVCIMVAGLLGLVAGWFLKMWFVADLEAEWRGRLDRDDWVRGARSEHARKYGNNN